MDLNNQKLLKGKSNPSVGQVEDRISELPDSLLHYILSFLDNIKNVARTCILSKRWKHIWTSIPALDLQFWDVFGPPSLSEINMFMDFVDRTLLLHHPSNIQKFKLSLYKEMNASRVHSWIENLTSRNVEELSLNLDFDQDIALSIPLSLFTCESLTKLELCDGPSIHFPNSISFPKLKSLTLSRIQFGNDCWNEQPFSNFLVLEELILDNCTWFGMRKFCIINPVLKSLNIYKAYDDEGGLEDCDLKIHAPNLVSLKWWGCLAKDYDMSSFLKLDIAQVVFFIFEDESGSGEQRICHAVRKFLQALSHVRRLSLNLDIEKGLSFADGFVSNLPIYHNLNKLSLTGEATKHKLIYAFLKATPNLKSLSFYQYDESSCDDDKEYDEREDLFRHLQSVRFIGFNGRRRELRWAKLILKNAKSLQKMTICINKEVLVPELSNLPRASERCVIKVVKNLW